MYLFRRMRILLICSVMALSLLGCEKPKEGKVIITDQQFSIRQDSNYAHNWFVDAKGKVKNIGDVDVKNLVITGHCLSCDEVIISGKWFISDIEKMPNQKDIISYLPAGAEEEFSFQEVALMMEKGDNVPDQMPDKMECKVISFETVQD